MPSFPVSFINHAYRLRWLSGSSSRGIKRSARSIDKFVYGRKSSTHIEPSMRARGNGTSAVSTLVDMFASLEAILQIVPASAPFDNNQFGGRRRGEKAVRNSKKLARNPQTTHTLKQRPLPERCRGCRLLRGRRQRKPFAVRQLLPVGHQAGPRRAQPPTCLGER